MAETKEQTQPRISWSAPEFIHYPKNPAWFIIAGIIGLGLVVYFFFQKDWLTSALFLLLLVVVWYFARQKPKTINIELSGRGVKINETVLSYQQIKSFWIVYEPPAVKTLNFETAAYLNPNYTLQLGDQDPVAIRKFLLEYLPEDLERGEAVSDKIARKLKF